MAHPGPAAGAARASHPGLAEVASAYQRFEPRAYLRNNYAPPRGDLSRPDGVGPWKLGCLARTFATGERGDRRQRTGERGPGGGNRRGRGATGERPVHWGAEGRRGCSEVRGEVAGEAQGPGGTETETERNRDRDWGETETPGRDRDPGENRPAPQASPA